MGLGGSKNRAHSQQAAGAWGADAQLAQANKLTEENNFKVFRLDEGSDQLLYLIANFTMRGPDFQTLKEINVLGFDESRGQPTFLGPLRQKFDVSKPFKYRQQEVTSTPSFGGHAHPYVVLRGINATDSSEKNVYVDWGEFKNNFLPYPPINIFNAQNNAGGSVPIVFFKIYNGDGHELWAKFNTLIEKKYNDSQAAISQPPTGGQAAPWMGMMMPPWMSMMMPPWMGMMPPMFPGMYASYFGRPH
jgi:hypothetical protein